jgi:hypothetical protein
MPMPMMDIGKMRMAVKQRLVTVLVGMRLFAQPIRLVRVPMVRIVDVHVVVRQRFVQMLVIVPFVQMEPDAESHQGCGDPEQYRDGLPEERYRDRGPDEWGSREIGAGARAAEMAQGDHEQHQAQTIAHESKQQNGGDVRWCRKLVAERQRQGGMR